MGEDLPDGGAIRDMETPATFDQPDRMTSSIYTADPDEEDGGGVHTNSGVNNKAAFLLTDGGTFNGRTVTGLGIAKVSRIYYEAQTALLTSASDYADLYSALQQACANLVGTAGITSGDCAEVTDAVSAVEMNVSPPDAPAPEATVCDNGAAPATQFLDTLENTGSGNWTAQAGWFYPANSNPFGFDAEYATSGTENFWGPDLEVPGGATYSISLNRDVAIPAGQLAYLRFNHAYGFEDSTGGSNYDAGVVEISTNGGASWTDARPLLTANGYNGTVSEGDGTNPLRGQRAFVRESNGYISSRATLTSLGGQNVRVRFKIGVDSSFEDFGWFIDDVRFYTCGRRADHAAPAASAPAASAAGAAADHRRWPGAAAHGEGARSASASGRAGAPASAAVSATRASSRAARCGSGARAARTRARPCARAAAR